MTPRKFNMIAMVLILGMADSSFIKAQSTNEPEQDCGQGTFRFFGWSIYQAKLTSPHCPVQASQRFTLRIHYFIPISQAHLIATTDQELNRMHGSWPQKTLQGWNKEMEQAFRSVHSGDTITGIYLPGVEAQFYLNNTPTTEIHDAEFAQWFFQIWLGPKAHDSKLRDQLNQGIIWNPIKIGV